MIASRGPPQRAASTSVLLTKNDEKPSLSIEFGTYRASSISLLEQEDQQKVPEGELATGLPSRRRLTRRGLNRAASVSVLQKEDEGAVGGELMEVDDDETGPESPPRRVSRSLQRAASVSVLGKDANESKTLGAGGGRTKTLVRSQSKRSLSRESASRRISSPSKKKPNNRNAPGRSSSGEKSLVRLNEKLRTLSEEDDDSSSAASDECKEAQEPIKEASSKSSSQKPRRAPPSVHSSSLRRKPSLRHGKSKPTRELLKSNKEHNGAEERISSLEDELIKARSLIETLQAQQQQKQEHTSVTSEEEEDDVDDEASAYQVTEVASGRKFGRKLLGGVLGLK